ncbi:hypothetical protein QOZ80_2AG0100460 [Eleusine coracana subsp. coracana]|nr:hypothetical protein QOZ80_2AG0100460 [Eleusine coracana subsp. coracana]
MAPGSRIVTEVPESDSGDDGISEALGSLIRLDGDSTHKPWSTTLANVALSSLSGLNDLLECPVCTNSMLPPILQCPNGHTICSSCKLRVENHCPTCRQELGNIRCLALEKVAEKLQLPCKYQSAGCSECLVIGDVPMLVSHLINDHKVDLHEGCTFNHRYVKSNPHQMESATWMLTVFKCFGQHFCLHFEAFLLGMAPVYVAFLRFMGEESEAQGFGYSLEVGGEGRKLMWQGTPRSIRDSHRTVRDSYDGLIIHRKMALFFSGGNRQELKLRITGRIWKEECQPGGVRSFVINPSSSHPG